jgi:hypothetical protein
MPPLHPGLAVPTYTWRLNLSQHLPELGPCLTPVLSQAFAMVTKEILVTARLTSVSFARSLAHRF